MLFLINTYLLFEILLKLLPTDVDDLIDRVSLQIVHEMLHLMPDSEVMRGKYYQINETLVNFEYSYWKVK